MADEKEVRSRVDQFILDEIDSVPHLEALLLLLSQPAHGWTVQEMAKALYVDGGYASRILEDLTQRKLASKSSEPTETYSYNGASPEKNEIVRALDRIYRREIVRISRMIHAKGSTAVREFAKAFRFTKDREN